MSDDIKELATLIRLNADARLWTAADALEAMAGELEAYESARITWAGMMRAWINRAVAAEAERDRLKAALVRLRDCDWVISLPDRMDAVREIAREALEAKE